MYTILYCLFFLGVAKKEKHVSHLEHDVECLMLKTSDVSLDVCSKNGQTLALPWADLRVDASPVIQEPRWFQLQCRLHPQLNEGFQKFSQVFRTYPLVN